MVYSGNTNLVYCTSKLVLARETITIDLADTSNDKFVVFTNPTGMPSPSPSPSSYWYAPPHDSRILSAFLCMTALVVHGSHTLTP